METYFSGAMPEEVQYIVNAIMNVFFYIFMVLCGLVIGAFLFFAPMPEIVGFFIVAIVTTIVWKMEDNKNVC